MKAIAYAPASILRNPRRTFSRILGVLIAIALLAGTLTSIDASANRMLQALLADDVADFYLLAETAQVDELQANISGISLVRKTIPTTQVHLAGVSPPDEELNVSSGAMGIDPDNPPVTFSMDQVRGNTSLGERGVIVSRGIAEALVVDIGQSLLLRGFSINETAGTTKPRTVNVTVKGVIQDGPFLTSLGAQKNHVIFHLQETEWLARALWGERYADTVRTTFSVYIHRDAVLQPYAVEQSQRELDRLEREFQAAVSPYGGNVDNNLSKILAEFEIGMDSQRVLYGVLAFPFIVIGLYLGAVGAALGQSEQRREMVTLRIRGLGEGDLLRLLLWEAVLLGVIAGGAGLVVGVGLSYLLFSALLPGASAGFPSEVVLLPQSAGLALALAVAFMVAVGYRSTKRLVEIPPREALRYEVSSESQIQYKPHWDLSLVILAMVPLVGGLLARDSLVGFLVGPIAIALVPVAPLLFIVGGVRLASLSTNKVYGAASWVVRPLTGRLAHLVRGNLSRHPRRTANLSVVIALGVAYGALVLSVFGSITVMEERELAAHVGSDILIEPPEGSEGFLDEVTAMEGVEGATEVRRMTGFIVVQIPTGTQQIGTQIVALDPSSYFDVIESRPWYYSKSTENAVRETLSNKGQVLLSSRLDSQTDFAVGDRVSLSPSLGTGNSEETPVEVSVGGTVRVLPPAHPVLPDEGFFDFLDRRPVPHALYGSFETLWALFNSSDAGEESADFQTRILARLHATEDWRSVKAALLELGAQRVVVHDEEWSLRSASPVAQSMFGFARALAGFAVVFLTLGLGLVLVANGLERRVEFATIRARGANWWHAGRVLFGEALTVLLVATVIGLSVGLTGAYLAIDLFPIEQLGRSTGEPLVPLIWVVPPEAILFAGVAGAGMIAGSFLAIWLTLSGNLSRVLKTRIG